MTKYLDVAQCLTIIDHTDMALQSYMDHFDFMEAAISRVLELEGSLKGKGGEALLRNYQELQLPAIRAARAFISSMKDKGNKLRSLILSFEPSENGMVSEDFYRNQVTRGYDRFEQFMEQNKAEVDAIAASVSHIIDLGKLDIRHVQDRVDDARKHAKDVVEGLYELDHEGMRLMRELQREMAELKAILKQVTEWTVSGGALLNGVDLNEVRSHFADKTLHTKAPEVSVKLATPNPLVQYANDFPLRFKYDTMHSIMKVFDLSHYQKWFSSMIRSLPLTSFFNVARASTGKISDTGSDVSQTRMEWEEPDTTGRKYVQIEVATGVRIWVWSSDGKTATPEDLRFTEKHDEWKRKYGVKEETDPTLEQLMMDNYKDHAERLRTGVNPETGEALTEVERMQSWSVVLSGPSTLASLAYWGNRWGNVKVNSGIVDKKPTSKNIVKGSDDLADATRIGDSQATGGTVNNLGKGTGNVLSSQGRVTVDAIKSNPNVFKGKSTDEIAQMLRDNGYDVVIEKSKRSSSGAEIIKINNHGSGRNITQVQVSPGGGRHGNNPYVKISTSDQGIIKVVDGSPNSYLTDGAEKATIIFTGGK